MGCVLALYCANFATFRVKGGNYLIYENMLKETPVKLNTPVSMIEKVQEGFFLTYQENGLSKTDFYDIVVIASPIVSVSLLARFRH